MVRSLSMDSWSRKEILSMLEGGNKQLSGFFDRHNLSTIIQDPYSSHMEEDPPPNRYKTNAAMFYKDNLSLHVQNVNDQGVYKGRHSFRKKSKRKGKKNSKRRERGEQRRDRNKKIDESTCSTSTTTTCSNESSVGTALVEEETTLAEAASQSVGA